MLRDCRVFGENRIQEFSGKADTLRDLQDAEWHMIGHLQSNKAARQPKYFPPSILLIP